jgi:hypothetical protein
MWAILQASVRSGRKRRWIGAPGHLAVFLLYVKLKKMQDITYFSYTIKAGRTKVRKPMYDFCCQIGWRSFVLTACPKRMSGNVGWREKHKLFNFMLLPPKYKITDTYFRSGGVFTMMWEGWRWLHARRYLDTLEPRNSYIPPVVGRIRPAHLWVAFWATIR